MEQKYIASSRTLLTKILWKPIFVTALLVGTLDSLGAILVYNANPMRVFQYIASGVFGAEIAFAGGLSMVMLGIVFHYFIAFCWTTLFFLAYPVVSVLRKNKYVIAVAYGVFVWIFMNVVVLPLTKIPQGPFHFQSALKGAAILVVAIGLPVSILAHRYCRSLHSLNRDLVSER